MKKQPVRKSISINLLDNDHHNTFDIFISWALSTGRIIIIVTEIVALVAFLQRFDLDEKLSDLHSKMKFDQQVVDALQSNEKTYRSLQFRLQSESQLNNSNAAILKYLA